MSNLKELYDLSEEDVDKIIAWEINRLGGVQGLKVKLAYSYAHSEESRLIDIGNGLYENAYMSEESKEIFAAKVQSGYSKRLKETLERLGLSS